MYQSDNAIKLVIFLPYIITEGKEKIENNIDP
jgi:hypothetical protein